jgi:hypothetical protein
MTFAFIQFSPDGYGLQLKQGEQKYAGDREVAVIGATQCEEGILTWGDVQKTPVDDSLNFFGDHSQATVIGGPSTIFVQYWLELSFYGFNHWSLLLGGNMRKNTVCKHAEPVA